MTLKNYATPIALFIFVLITFSCSVKEQDEKYNIEGYVAQYDTVWPQVADYIQESWDKSSSVSSNLPHPFIAAFPGSMVMYYWDTWFINKGLLINGEFQRARNNIDNHLFQIEKMGYVPSVNTAWGNLCSQPPYLSSMVKEYYESASMVSPQWLDSAYRLLKTEYTFWTNATDTIHNKRASGIPGLSRYFHEEDPMDMMLFYSKVMVSRLKFPPQVPEEMMMKATSSFLAEVESGMDFTPRFEQRCPDFVALDLNVCLYLYEQNFAWMVKELALQGEPEWEKRAENRRLLIQKHCWNEDMGLFMDFDYKNNRFSEVPAVTAFTPLMAGIATAEQAEQTRQNLDLFEYDMGVSVCPKEERDKNYLWDYPAAWPPMQFYVIEGLRRYGMDADARRVAIKYLDLVSQNFLYPIPEACSDIPEIIIQRDPGRLFNKYSVQGSVYDAEYCASVTLGWSAGVFLHALAYIEASQTNQPQVQK